MSKLLKRRDFLGLAGVALVTPIFASSVEAQEPLSALARQIKSHIGLNYRLERIDTPTNFSMSGMTRGCDPLLPVAERLSNEMQSDTGYNLILTGEVNGLDMQGPLDSRSVTIVKTDTMPSLTAREMYDLLDERMNTMATEWANEATPEMIQALQKPLYTMKENCNYS